ncbi:class I SAM-dependent methyltransferase [Angustibacter luteus]|uniref:Class I SAM-dependent methyltransferase n=1 Tax=Angustibacter luteus TaxID=658456 RepID=A0ABW1JF84_9ACTN
MDWALGNFEKSAGEIRPASEQVVDALAPARGDVVLDLGCGTGNAALIAAARGAVVTGVDPAERLLDIARADAAAAGLDITFAAGDAATIPLPDDSVDAVISVFAVIFAPDAAAAAAEMARVLRPGGTLVLSAWRREGALAAQADLRLGLLDRAGGPAPAGPLFAWHDEHALTELLSPYGFAVTTTEHTLAFTAASPAAFADHELVDHPMWVESRELLERAGLWEQARRDLTRAFDELNEDPAAFRITGRYVVATAARRG